MADPDRELAPSPRETGGEARPETPGPAGSHRAVVDVEVRYAETDQMGVVHHANYLIWFELARTALCRETGFHYSEIEEMGYLLAVTAARVDYRRGARYGDRVRVLCELERLASRRLAFAYRVLRGDELLVTGTTEHVWLDAATGRACRIPERLRGPFESLLAAGR